MVNKLNIMRLIFIVVSLMVLSLPLAAQGNFTAYQIEVIRSIPHDTGAWTQGLLIHDGYIYESIGAYDGESSLRQIDLETGEILAITNVVPKEEYYAEGLALVDDRLIQITWTEQIANVYDLETLEQVDQFTYEGQGWGLCYDGRYLYMSDGTQYLSVRDPQTFDLIFKGVVTLQDFGVRLLGVSNERVMAQQFPIFMMDSSTVVPDSEPLDDLNELECVGDSIYANVWETDLIVEIDKHTGVIKGIIYANNLLTEAEKAEMALSTDVLNGIAYNPETDTFYLTGKHWPKIFEVRFVPMPPQ